MKEYRQRQKWAPRFLAIGTYGFAGVVVFLMVLMPVSGTIVHSKVLGPAYKNTGSSPSSSMSVNGCTKVKAPSVTWNPTSGVIAGISAASAKTCPKIVGFIGGSSYATASSGIAVGIPFKVATNGNHSVATSFGLNLASIETYTSAGCPAKNVNYFPALYAYSSSSCQSGAYRGWNFGIEVIDLSNNSWAGNYSYGSAYNSSGWQNSTYCYNYGTPSCSNSTAGFNYAGNYSYLAPGFSSFRWNGGTSWTSWTNGTAMKKADRYLLFIGVTLYTTGYATASNLRGPWPAAGLAVVNMGTLGNGLTVNSVTIS